MVTNKKLFVQGWKSTQTVLTARLARATSNLAARHVSAKDLYIKEEAPSLANHKLLHPEDKEVETYFQTQLGHISKKKHWSRVPFAFYGLFSFVLLVILCLPGSYLVGTPSGMVW